MFPNILGFNKKAFIKQCQDIQNSVWGWKKSDITKEEIEKLCCFDNITFRNDNINVAFEKVSNDTFEIKIKRKNEKAHYVKKCVEPYHEIWSTGDWNIIDCIKNLIRNLMK